MGKRKNEPKNVIRKRYKTRNSESPVNDDDATTSTSNNETIAVNLQSSDNDLSPSVVLQNVPSLENDNPADDQPSVDSNSSEHFPTSINDREQDDLNVGFSMDPSTIDTVGENDESINNSVIFVSGASMVAQSSVSNSETVNSVTPPAVDLLTPPNETETSLQEEFMFPTENIEVGIPALFLEPSVSAENSTPINCCSVEIIDVDKLPDRPDSPVGDDVVEILPPVDNTNSFPQPILRRFVDLTDHTGNSAQQSTEQHDDSNSSNYNSDGEDEQETIPFLEPSTTSCSSTSLPSTSSSSKSLDTNESNETKKIVGISCPICMDDASLISSSKRQLMSTPCGHIFCNDCLDKALSAKGICPTCRNKVPKKKLHPIFI